MVAEEVMTVETPPGSLTRMVWRRVWLHRYFRLADALKLDSPPWL